MGESDSGAEEKPDDKSLCDTKIPITNYQDRETMIKHGWSISGIQHGNIEGDVFEGWGSSEDIGQMSYTLQQAGQAKVVYSNKLVSATNNEVAVYLNGVLLDIALGDNLERTLEFDFKEGDVLEFIVGFTIIDLYEITVTRPCEPVPEVPTIPKAPTAKELYCAEAEKPEFKANMEMHCMYMLQGCKLDDGKCIPAPEPSAKDLYCAEAEKPEFKPFMENHCTNVLQGCKFEHARCIPSSE